MTGTTAATLDDELHIRIRTDLAAQLVEIARQLRVSKSVLARHILEEHLHGYRREFLVD